MDAPQDQPAAPESIADRVAAQFGVADDPAENQETAPQPESVEAPEGQEAPAPENDFAEVEYEGARYQVPKPLEKAILQQKDYTQKTQKVAEQERQYAALQEQGKLANLKHQFESHVESELTQLKAFDSVLSQPMEWDKIPDAEVPRMLAQRAQWKEQRDALAQALQQKYQQFNQHYERAVGEAKAKAIEAVSKSIPNWSESTLKDLREYGKSDGYSDVELSAIDTDPRHVRTLYKAMQYDKLTASKAQAVQTATKAPPMVKPGSTRPMPQAVKDDFALRKAQSNATNSAEKARIIQRRLEGRF
jgi:type I site-specific restriction endonuclease